MEKGKLVPESVFRDRYLRRYGSCPNFPAPSSAVTTEGYMLQGREIGEFLFSGNILGLDFGDEPIHEVNLAIPQPRQHGLYQEIATMRRHPPIRTVFFVDKRSNRSIKSITALSQGEDESDVYMATARVGKGRRVTSVMYGYYELPDDLADFPQSIGVVGIESIRSRRMGVVPQAPSLVM